MILFFRRFLVAKFASTRASLGGKPFTNPDHIETRPLTERREQSCRTVVRQQYVRADCGIQVSVRCDPRRHIGGIGEPDVVQDVRQRNGRLIDAPGEVERQRDGPMLDGQSVEGDSGATDIPRGDMHGVASFQQMSDQCAVGNQMPHATAEFPGQQDWPHDGPHSEKV